MKEQKKRFFSYLLVLVMCGSWGATAAWAGDLAALKERGVLRHLGIPYVNFVTVSNDGLDVELVRLFAQDLKVKYQFVETNWGNVISDLTGKKVKPRGNEVEVVGTAPINWPMAVRYFWMR